MKSRFTLLLLAAAGCSTPATSAQRGDAGRDAAPDASAPDAPAPDAPAPDAPAPDAPAPDVPAPDVPAPDAPAPASDVPAPDVPAGAARVVQLGGDFVGAGTQSRLDALFAVLGVSAERVEPAAVTADRLRGAVIVAAFAARPVDWTAARSRVVLDAVRAGAWMLGDAFGPWPLHAAGALSLNELQWSRTAPCFGTFFWLQPARGEDAYFAFGGIAAWAPTSGIVPQSGPVVLSYPSDSVPMTIPVFGALPPATATRHEFLRYVQSYCEPAKVQQHPWCVDNPGLCNGERGVQNGWVDEFVVGSGRLFNVVTASHATASFQWGEVVTRLQANVVREGLRRLAR